ncbi:MAG: class I SAM-dependent methyltransferase [Janthinobacterium lividum]
MLFHLILRRLVRRGTLLVRYPDGTEQRYGDGGAPAAAFALTTRRAVRRMVSDPSLALGELYMSGELVPLECTVYDALDIFLHNLQSGQVHPMETGMRALRRLRRRVDQFNPAPRARRNVAHHYDLDDRLYSLFLDADRQYSCAYFETPSETLEAAQAAKQRHIAAKLHLHRPGLEVLDIGCGWGGMALTLARDHGARVTGITLSAEQLGVARQRAAAAGLSDQVRFELMDYRAWSAPVDRVVSVGMFEHVGVNHYTTFFRSIRRMLRPGGVALVHAIGRAGGPGVTNPFLAKYIFPGGYLPALSEVLPAVERSGLWTADLEVLRLHYALTLRHWRERFAAHRERIAAVYDERFCRMFEFYLAGSEVAFRRADHMVWQLQLCTAVGTLPITRDYMLGGAPAGG